MKTNDIINQANHAYLSANKNPIMVSSNENSREDQISIFANFVKQNLNQSLNKVKQADNIAINALQGKADVANVVIAFAEAEQMVNEIVAIKQALLNALNDILKLSF